MTSNIRALRRNEIEIQRKQIVSQAQSILDKENTYRIKKAADEMFGAVVALSTTIKELKLLPPSQTTKDNDNKYRKFSESLESTFKVVESASERLLKTPVWQRGSFNYHELPKFQELPPRLKVAIGIDEILINQNLMLEHPLLKRITKQIFVDVDQTKKFLEKDLSQVLVESSTVFFNPREDDLALTELPIISFSRREDDLALTESTIVSSNPSQEDPVLIELVEVPSNPREEDPVLIELVEVPSNRREDDLVLTESTTVSSNRREDDPVLIELVEVPFNRRENDFVLTESATVSSNSREDNPILTESATVFSHDNGNFGYRQHFLITQVFLRVYQVARDLGSSLRENLVMQSWLPPMREVPAEEAAAQDTSLQSETLAVPAQKRDSFLITDLASTLSSTIYRSAQNAGSAFRNFVGF
jgi:hypothetical protein